MTIERLHQSCFERSRPSQNRHRCGAVAVGSGFYQQIAGTPLIWLVVLAPLWPCCSEFPDRA
jgi:hypothetical protein